MRVYDAKTFQRIENGQDNLWAEPGILVGNVYVLCTAGVSLRRWKYAAAGKLKPSSSEKHPW
jgi:hypothetical protein